MKRFLNPIPLSRLCIGAGVVCLALRQWLLTAGIDEKGLLDHTHPGYRLSWLAVLLVAVLLLLSLRNRTAVRLVPSRKAVVGHILGAVGYLIAGISLLREPRHSLIVPAAFAGLAAAACALWIAAGICRRKRIHPLAHCPSVLFFLLLLVCRYQIWNSEPEPQFCFFHILALGLLAAALYTRGMMAISRKNWRGYVQFSRCAIFFSLAAIPGCVDAFPLLLWALSLMLDGCIPRKQS